MNLSGTSATTLQCIPAHKSDVTSCDFAPNFTLVTASSDKTVRLWDWLPGSGFTERSSSPLKAHKYGVTCVKVSPQGSMLVTSSIDGTAILWNLHCATKLHTFTQINGDPIRVCRFSPDSFVVATGGDNGAICIWDIVHKSLIRTLHGHEGTAQSLAFTPDSQYLASGCTLDILNVWFVPDLLDTTIDEKISPAAILDNVHDLGITSMDISNNILTDENDPLTKHYTLAMSGNSERILIWTITTRTVPKNKMISQNFVVVEKIRELKGHSSAVTCVKYNNSGAYLVSASLDKLLKIWDDDGGCIGTLKAHSRYVNCAAFSRDSTLLASGSNDKSLIVWDLTGGSLTVDSELLRTHHQLGALIGNGMRETQLIQNSELDEKVHLIERVDDISDAAINSCCFYGEDLLATGSSDKQVKLFRLSDEGHSMEELQTSPIDGHTYAINYVEFSMDGSLLATCSQDGSANIWDHMSGEKLYSIPEVLQAIRVCKFSPDGTRLVTAGDDEVGIVWNIETMEKLAVMEGHCDAITSASFTPDGLLVATTSHNGDFRLWLEDRNIYIHDDAHDLGIQCCDFSQNSEPIPNVIKEDVQNYLLATCGNDGYVKLWRITCKKDNDDMNDNACNAEIVNVKLWRTLVGHGGTIYFVKFSPQTGEIVCSTATDRQARIWSVYSGECLHVLDHDSIVICCSFSASCSMLATGCLDKTLWLWKLPQQLVFQSCVANKIKARAKAIIDWTVQDVVNWLTNVELDDIIKNATNANLDGHRLLTVADDRICAALDLNDTQTDRLTREIRWLKQSQLPASLAGREDIPDSFLCPITQEIMLEPVTCSDGFTYEKRAITEWFLSGKFTSPMTNMTLPNTEYKLNNELKNEIYNFLYADKESG